MVVLEEKGNIKTLVPSHGLCETDLEELINEYEKELRYFAYKIVRDWIIVDDIMQEVFIKIFLKLDSFEKRSSIRSWLYKITYNQCIDYFRSKTIKSPRLIEYLEEIKVANTDSAEIEAIEKFEKEWLCHTVNSLPNQYKEPILLFYFKQYSYKEISETLNENIGVIKNRLFRGRRLLKEKYFDYQVSYDRKGTEL
ncbi:RNA polymerase sigma factor [Heyndrickxia sp. FSL W8-0423]|uniref:RNA polymerase sigma factor n=1 Tax=Heyndrickxia sp. FSL W8-0423 TaxID=2921601 RepID=UPI0030FB6BDF